MWKLLVWKLLLNKNNDNYLWQKMKGGNQDALSELFRNHYHTLYDHGVKFCHREELVKDCIQDVFIYIWEKRKNLSDAVSVRAYLLASTRRRLLKMLKELHQKENRDYQISIISEENVMSAEDIIASEENEFDKKQLLKKILKKIPARMREALYLKTFDGLSYREISQIMNISPQVARNYISEAFRRIREITAKQI